LKDEKIKWSKFNFYVNYFLKKVVLLPFEVKKPKLKFYIYELLYSFLKIFNRKSMLCYPFKDDIIIIKYGSFYIRPKTADAAVISPAYEFPDKNELLKIVNNLIKSKKILFVDIGANIGAYSIYFGKKINHNNLKIIAIEASPYNFEILTQNIKLNKLEDLIETINIALWDKDDGEIIIAHNKTVPGGSFIIENKIENNNIETLRVKTMTLSRLLQKFMNSFDVLIIKIDVEGSEEKILKTCQGIFDNFKEIYILIESVDEEKIKTLLKKLGFKKFIRHTPYNILAHK